MATETKESVISTIVLNKRQYTNRVNKVIYVHEILMDNGDKGENHRQTENIPEKNGDKVKYEIESTVRGQFTDTRIKFIGDKPFTPKSSSQNFNGYNKATPDQKAMKEALIVTQNATNRAVELVWANKVPLDQLEHKAEEILEMMLRIAERNAHKFVGKTS